MELTMRKNLFLLLILSSTLLLSACGSNTTTAPDLSTVTVGPDFSQTGVASFPVPHPFTVTVRYADGSPMPKSIVNISGHYASNKSEGFTGPYTF